MSKYSHTSRILLPPSRFFFNPSGQYIVGIWTGCTKKPNFAVTWKRHSRYFSRVWCHLLDLWLDLSMERPRLLQHLTRLHLPPVLTSASLISFWDITDVKPGLGIIAPGGRHSFDIRALGSRTTTTSAFGHSAFDQPQFDSDIYPSGSNY
ncbi:hypothetical protein D9619_000169 [Psilocybe cf. subviscida]|uniref:Uncharacterized protein n=1 Tax=Psilocybe cf. subviscida TaxID=2480587 RepID=A0A8H5BFI0_9AGAR|nr:hypothetical protein D9619_000169 [Psilocybe cf. subviscida]